MQIFHCSSLIFVFPINCWSGALLLQVTLAAAVWADLTVSEIVWESLLSHGSSPFFTLGKKNTWNISLFGTAASRSWGDVHLISKQFFIRQRKPQGLHLKKNSSFDTEKRSVDGSIGEALRAFTLKWKAAKEWLTESIFLVAFLYKYRSTLGILLT